MCWAPRLRLDAPTLPRPPCSLKRHQVMNTRPPGKSLPLGTPHHRHGRAEASEDASIVESRCRSWMRQDPGFPAFICSRARPESATQRNATQTQPQGANEQREVFGQKPSSSLLALQGQERRHGSKSAGQGTRQEPLTVQVLASLPSIARAVATWRVLERDRERVCVCGSGKWEADPSRPQSPS